MTALSENSRLRITYGFDGATEVAHNLWVGSRLPAWPEGFDLVVFCETEYQPAWRNIEGWVLRCPFEDAGLDPGEQARVIEAASIVLATLDADHRVLITCYAGRNRSGLVAACALVRQGRSVEEAIAAVRRVRSNGPFGEAMSNPVFLVFLEAYARALGTARS